jgi:hypothetical protein
LSRSTNSSGATVWTIGGALGTGNLREVETIKQPESRSEGSRNVIEEKRKLALIVHLPASWPVDLTVSCAFSLWVIANIDRT